MPDPGPGDDLTARALLYVLAELGPEEAAAFDRRLAVDQTARDALAEAVRLSAVLEGRPEPVPDPAYRTVVHRRLARRAGSGVALAWAGVGAAAAAVLLLAIGSRLATVPEPDMPLLPDPAAHARPAVRPEVAHIWAEVNDHANRHLTHSLNEKARRKPRGDFARSRFVSVPMTP